MVIDGTRRTQDAQDAHWTKIWRVERRTFLGDIRMAGKRSSGEGSIIYDKRRKKPYRARITVGWDLDEQTGRVKQIFRDLGSYRTKGEASRALAEYLKNPYDLDNKNITFSQLYEKWYEDFMTEEHISHKYRIKAAYNYCSLLYNKKVRDITVLDMKSCIYKGTVISKKGADKGKERYASPATKESMKFLFNHLFGYAAEARLIERNYALDFSLDKKVLKEKEIKHKEKIPFSEEEMDKLWKSIEFVPFADMIIYACYSGWRPSELVLLKIEDVDLNSGFIRGGIKTSAGKNRLVPVHSLVKNIVEKYYNQALKVNSAYLFNDIDKKKGIGLTYDQYLSRFNKVMRALNFREGITPHYTRHTFITKAKSRGVNMNDNILKLIVGHKIGDLTEHVYTHRELTDLKEEIELIKS